MKASLGAHGKGGARANRQRKWLSSSPIVVSLLWILVIPSLPLALVQFYTLLSQQQRQQPQEQEAVEPLSFHVDEHAELLPSAKTVTIASSATTATPAGDTYNNNTSPSKQQQAGKVFNYTAFWQDARNAALVSLQKEQENAKTLHSRPCPKVYVYDIFVNDHFDVHNKPFGFGPNVTLDKKTLTTTTTTSSRSTMSMLDGHLYKTNQYAFASILYERFMSTSSSCVTKDPNEADLFFVPILPSPKDGDMWKQACAHVNGTTVLDEMRKAVPQFWNATTNNNNTTNKYACRHFFAIGKGHTDVTTCDGWFSNPIPPLAPFARLAYSNYSFHFDKHKGHVYENTADSSSSKSTTSSIATAYPNLYSVPYPSSLHFSANDTSLSDSLFALDRKVLMLFMGKDGHGDVPVRRKMTKQCQGYRNRRVCTLATWKGKPDFILAKLTATFCLEPAGDTPGRKSLSDSIAFGCIPILFSELTDDVAPWHWLDWKDRARVLVPRQDFVNGKIDLKTLLQSIPQDLLRLMKETLRDKARRFQYSLDDDPEDGVRIVLDNLHRQALEREQQGTCGMPI